MGGQWETYRCQRCPLVLELGGLVAADAAGAVTLEMHQLACPGCGTLHRLAEDGAGCRLSALSGPIRAARKVLARDISGDEFVVESWVSEDDWRPVGPLPAGVGPDHPLTCAHCGLVGRMLPLASLLYPDGYVRGAPKNARCPTCRGPMECVGISDSI